MMQSYFLSSILSLWITFCWCSLYGGWGGRCLNEDQQQRKARVRPSHAVSVYMWDIYNKGVNWSEVNVVKGIYPKTSDRNPVHVRLTPDSVVFVVGDFCQDVMSALLKDLLEPHSPNLYSLGRWNNPEKISMAPAQGFPFKSRIYRTHCRRQLEFNIPKPQQDEVLVKAEVRITKNKMTNGEVYFQIYLKAKKWIFLNEKKVSDVDVPWLSLHVTPIKNIKPGVVTFLILTLFRDVDKNCHDFFHPVLLLSYLSKRDENSARRKRSLQSEDYEEETNRIWKDELFPEGVSKIHRRARSLCRKKSLYIQFSEIDYDSWIVAPSGYEAFQCVGKCTFPVGEHLSPTKHAILQSLIHNMHPSKASRACCVPTRLDPISILYIDEDGVLTYRFRYRDMVVAECGCR